MTNLKSFPLISLVVGVNHHAATQRHQQIGDIFVLAGLVALFADLVHGGGSRALRVVLAGLTAAAALICLLVVGFAGTATFLLLTAMTLVVAAVRAIATR